MTIDTSKLQASTKKLMGLVVAAGTLFQIPAVHDFVLVQVHNHPHLAGIVATLTGIFTLQTGQPINWDNGSTTTPGDYIYYGGPLNLQNNQPNGTAFNTAQFNTVSAQQLADNIQTFDLQFNNLRRNHTSEIDTSMDKKFQFAERKYIQIRFEAFNLQNRVTFGAPNTTPTSAAFGEISNQANTPRRLETAIRLVW